MPDCFNSLILLVAGFHPISFRLSPLLFPLLAIITGQDLQPIAESISFGFLHSGLQRSGC